MKLKEFVHTCQGLKCEQFEITVNLFKDRILDSVTLFSLFGDNLEYGCINERFCNAEIKTIYAIDKNKFSVFIQPD